MLMVNVTRNFLIDGGIKVLKRLLTVVLSVVLFSTLFSLVSYISISQRESNDFFIRFLGMFMIGIIYAGPIYFLVGLPLSICIDKLIEKFNKKSKWARYFVGLGLYSLAGTLAGDIFVIIFNPKIHLYEVISHAIAGIIASTIYFHLSLLISSIYKK